MRYTLLCLFLCGVVATVNAFNGTSGNASVTEVPFGAVDGKRVSLYTLTSISGMKAAITNYGGIVVSLFTPDKDGVQGDVVLGYDSLDQYLKDSPYFGAIVGRYANRIARAKFTLNGREYLLAANNGVNHLHGGVRGFDKVIWTAMKQVKGGSALLILRYVSRDGEEGYPGTLTSTVTYELTNHNELRISYEATTDRATVINLTHHSYFNLEGAGSGDILDHRMTINARRFTPVDSTLIPTGELAGVEGTPFDFRMPHAIGERIGSVDTQIRYGGGYDHNFVIDRQGSGLVLAAKVEAPVSGRIMEVLTSEPGLQFYSGNFLDGRNIGKQGKPYARRNGFCLETQHFPDSPNHPSFPSVALLPGTTFKSTTVYRFSHR